MDGRDDPIRRPPERLAQLAWSSFADELRAITRWQVSGEDPGAGAVVTFTDAGASMVVARGLSAPVQVVEVIAARTGG
jgi:hypothetical protein